MSILDQGNGVSDTILIAGSGRSGTTWIAEVVAQATQSRLVFEPFLQDAHRRFSIVHQEAPKQVDVLLQVDRQPYIPSGNKSSGHDPQLMQILEGRLSHFWYDQCCLPGSYSQRVIKDIRANLALGYLVRRWPSLQTLFVIRNPLSVVNSQIAKRKHGWTFEWQPDFVLGQPALMADWLAPFRDRITAATSLIERLTVKWCIENYIALPELENCDNVLILQYEELAADKEHWKPVHEFLSNSGWDEQRFRDSVNRVSLTAERPRQLIEKKIEFLPHLSQDDCATIAGIVHEFGLSRFLDYVPRFGAGNYRDRVIHTRRST